MATDKSPEETAVSDSGMVTIPASLRRRLDIEAGDKLRWDVDEEGGLSVRIVRQRYGAFGDDDRKADMGGDCLETHDVAGCEADSTFPEDT
ncbi:AbrB family transcriptional regulator [Halobacteriales archaeon QS_6_71_20]|nr:MAG: AbrB family transcriptional regulator [Halobacteriales archaeon QS_6_71_20]